MRNSISFVAAIVGGAACCWAVFAQEAADATKFESVEELIVRYRTDRDALAKFYGWSVLSESHRKRMEDFYSAWEASLGEVDYAALSSAGEVDYQLIKHRLEYRRKSLATNWKKLQGVSELVAFKDGVLGLYEASRKREKMVARDAAEQLAMITKAVENLKGKVSIEEGDDKLLTNPVLALRAQKVVGEVSRRLDSWYRFYAGFDPEFSWWAKQAHGELKTSLDAYEKHLGELVTGSKDGSEAPLVGDPIGAEALEDDLALEMLAYSPKELLAIGEREFAWCRAEMVKAAGEMGLGDDWRAALEEVKADFVPPGEQDDLAASIANEAIAFIDDNELVTVPDLCRETWYLTMLGKKQQETLPYAAYFGQAIGLAFPTEDMSVEQKLMSLRGNNRHFTRAVIPHELVPGHHLQKFMAQRHATHRGIFSTPFYVEGWALHWEMLLYDLKYPRTPEERIGMLFWRAHRCARIIVSLRFHLGEMSPEEMVSFLTGEVGMEESGARGEVRRYIGDRYSPLYQCGYMLGGLQLRAIYQETVGEGAMTAREFHDAVLMLGPVPMEMVRASLLGKRLEQGHRSEWRF
ncbi:MAG: hypothetical protein ACI9UA_005572 [Pseudoalteromonas tetraodonis]|jgi:uncharacterized protein (DUF885 family)